MNLKPKKTLSDIESTSSGDSDLSRKIKAVTNEVEALVQPDQESKEQISLDIAAVSARYCIGSMG